MGEQDVVVIEDTVRIETALLPRLQHGLVPGDSFQFLRCLVADNARCAHAAAFWCMRKCVLSRQRVNPFAAMLGNTMQGYVEEEPWLAETDAEGEQAMREAEAATATGSHNSLLQPPTLSGVASSPPVWPAVVMPLGPCSGPMPCPASAPSAAPHGWQQPQMHSFPPPSAQSVSPALPNCPQQIDSRMPGVGNAWPSLVAVHPAPQVSWQGSQAMTTPALVPQRASPQPPHVGAHHGSQSALQMALPHPTACAAHTPQQPMEVSQGTPNPKRFRCTGKLAAKRLWCGKQVGPAESDQQVSDNLVAQLGLATEQRRAKNRVYLVTLPHTAKPNLCAPESMSRSDILDKLRGCFEQPMHAYDWVVDSKPKLLKMALGREPHSEPDCNGVVHFHDHIALVADRSFRFLPVKRALLERHRLASHWGCGHEGYWSAVRYIVMPSPHKPAERMDKRPETWAVDGQHPPLFDAAQEPSSAKALRARHEKAAKAAAEQGKPERRVCEIDLYPIIVEQQFRNTPDDQHADLKLISYVKKCPAHCSVECVWFARPPGTLRLPCSNGRSRTGQSSPH